MITAIAIFSSIIVVVQTFILWREISDRVHWRHTLDAITNTCEQVESLKALQNALVANVSDKVQLVTLAASELSAVLQDVREVRDSMTALMSSQGYEWIREYGPRFMDDVIRNVTKQLSTHLEMGLIDRTTKFAGEYVLLQSLDDLELEVRLSARSYRPEAIRAALIKLLEWHPRKPQSIKSDKDLAEWFKVESQNAQEFDYTLGSLGEELLQLQWSGAIAVAKQQRQSPLPTTVVSEVPVAVPNTPRPKRA